MPSATRIRQAGPRPSHLRLIPTTERPRAPSKGATTDRTVATLLLATASLIVLGLVMVLSASSVRAYEDYGSSFLFFVRQLAYAVVGSAAFLLTARMRYTAWRRLCVPLLLLSVALLVIVLVPGVGTVAGGSARWIQLGPVTIQPSEPAKIAVIAFAAALLSRRWPRIRDLRELTLPLAPVVGVVAGLILLQPDMGTAVIVVASVFVVLFAAGARATHLFFGGAGLLSLGLGLMYVEGYRWARVVSFVNPWSDPQGSGYQTIQSMIALASGGPLGVGLGASRQKWSYVPNAHTDFIFSIIGEELGLIGGLAVLALFAALLFAGIRIALRAPDAFGRFLAVGITGWFGVQAVINLGAVTGLLPITGVPLPFVSFGGSSLVVSMAAVGILVSVARGARRARRG
ncbi:MAG TPA: putative lipid II flippase FtsW [Actinomycetota bacterium]|nr:putative lipid II flippase FtsW [Actinomycetota bacterium]